MLEGIHFDGRPQMIARVAGDGGGKSMLLNGHIDVVPAEPRAAWRRDPFEAHVEDGRLYGRGSCDMKGGVAAMVVAVETLAALGVSLKGDVVVNTVTDEESSGAGALACAWHGVRADACIVPEPTNLEIWLGCRGTCLATVEVDGRSAHVEIPQPDWTEGGGVNAIEKAMIVLAGLDRLNGRWASDPEHEHEFLSPGTISPVRIEAGDWPVTIPHVCEVDFDVTFPPALADEGGWDSRIRKEVEAELATIAAGDPWLAQNPPRLSWAMATPPLEISADQAPVPELGWALGQVGREQRFSGLDSWYDGATFARVHGVPAAGFGPGRIDVAHTRDEYVPVDDLVDCAAAIALALVSHCGLADSSAAESV